jgi:hypothetical protein
MAALTLQRDKLMINCMVWFPMSQFGTILGPRGLLEEVRVF